MIQNYFTLPHLTLCCWLQRSRRFEGLQHHQIPGRAVFSYTLMTEVLRSIKTLGTIYLTRQPNVSEELKLSVIDLEHGHFSLSRHYVLNPSSSYVPVSMASTVASA